METFKTRYLKNRFQFKYTFDIKCVGEMFLLNKLPIAVLHIIIIMVKRIFIRIYHSIYTIVFDWCTANSLRAHADPTVLQEACIIIYIDTFRSYVIVFWNIVVYIILGSVCPYHVQTILFIQFIAYLIGQYLPAIQVCDK